MLATVALAAGALVSLPASPAVAATSTTVVGNGDLSPNGPWALEPTSNTGTFSFVDGPNSPPGPVGSLAMNITTGQHAWLNNYSYGACATGPSCTNPLVNWQLLSSIDALSYSTYRTSGTTFPTYNMEVDWQGTGSSYTTFVFVPAGPIAANMWQTWNALNAADGTWYSTTNTGAGTPFNCNFQAAGCDHTWAQIQAGYPLARIKYGLGPNVGTGGTFTGNVDNFTIGISGNTTIYNFEPDCTTTCFVNSATGNDLNTGQSGDPMKTIQAAVNRVNVGGTVNAAAGTYIENVTVPKAVRITGAGNTTIVKPAISAPDPCGPSSLCPAASSVFLVRSPNVTIDHLLVDGNNPSLTSGQVFGGQDIDARNGIITDHTTAPCSTGCNNLSVHDVTVNNIFLRGIYASSGGTFNFSNNTVNNVQANGSSIGIFNFGGAGVMSGNHVNATNDAISSNHSAGTTFTNNVVTTSLSGVHTDNAGDGGGSADVISGNNVSCTAGSGAFGVWEFVPYKAPAISNNTVSGCDVGLAALGSCNFGGTNYCAGGVVPIVVFSNNNVTTTATAGALGFYVTTDTFGFGDGQVKANGDHNVIGGPGIGVYVEETGTETATVKVNRNSLLKAQNAGATTVDGTCNWWGQSSGPIAGQVTGAITTTPFLGSSDLNGPCPAPPPMTAPGVPRSPFAVPGNGSATVSWQAPSSNGGSPINGYIVTPVKNGVAQPARTFNSTATTQVVTGLTNGASYKFRIAARNAIGTGTAASTGGITVGAPGPPSKPTVTRPAAGSLKVTFTAPGGNGAPITSYTATCSSANGGVTGSKTGAKSPLTVTGLTAGKSYGCRVTATNSRGTGPGSPVSASITA